MSRTPTLEGKVALRDALIETLSETRRQFKALLPKLDPDVWDNGQVMAALRAYVTGSSVARIEICLQDVANVRSHASRLLTLCERLPSRCELRLAHAEHRDLPESFLLFDQRRYLRRATPLDRSWTMQAKGANDADRLNKLFDQVWGDAVVHPDLRRINL